ncbi:hypothetical protein L227DRAFT_617673 [Lentinus tigrinus ALCF2SS1-6]|uniref:Uncharacterized protein n=1 Tax=Lentinus tigrinus ALCF2SS1-6 TaxID=1328759 RepID=A0A5C2RNC3_9APHY|nr:hypothetical protein L227DRAFT_617673 [Lentinus tigrinus ALCF2SS1-6]
MEREKWAAWLDDVLWVFYELLNHMELHGKILLRSHVKTGDALSLFMGSNADAVTSTSEGGLVSGSFQPGPMLLPGLPRPDAHMTQNKKRSLDEREGVEASRSGSDSKRARGSEHAQPTQPVENEPRQLQGQMDNPSSPERMDRIGEENGDAEL